MGTYDIVAVFERHLNLLAGYLRSEVEKVEAEKAQVRLLAQPFTKALIEEKFIIKEEYGDPPILSKKNATERAEIREKLIAYYRNIANNLGKW